MLIKWNLCSSKQKLIDSVHLGQTLWDCQNNGVFCSLWKYFTLFLGNQLNLQIIKILVLGQMKIQTKSLQEISRLKRIVVGLSNFGIKLKLKRKSGRVGTIQIVTYLWLNLGPDQRRNVKIRNIKSAQYIITFQKKSLNDLWKILELLSRISISPIFP